VVFNLDFIYVLNHNNLSIIDKSLCIMAKKRSKEFYNLLEQVKKTDLTANNPEIQSVIESEIARWVDSYKNKKRGSLMDCYGEPGEIPDKISVNGHKYSPPQILEHVKLRDEIGMTVIRKIDEYQKQHPMWMGDKVADMFEGLGKNLDDVIMICVCGKHKKTTRDLMQDIIHPNSESLFLTVSLPDAIMRWYGSSAKYQMWDLKDKIEETRKLK